MDIYKLIIDTLKKEYADGATYKELEKKYGVSRTYIHQLLHGNRPVSRLTLEFFFKLFPHATVSITGNTVAQVVNNGNNSGTMTGIGTSDPTDKILDSEDLTAEEKIKMIKVLKK